MPDEFDDPFKLETGVKEDYDGVVADAWFGTRESSGQTLFLFLKILADDGEEVERRYSCGDDWSSFDGGKTAEHPNRKYFSNNSNIGQLVSAAFASGGEDELRKRSEALQGAGPKSADLWPGTYWHWDAKTEKVSVPDPEDSTKRTSRDVVRVLPTKFIGVKAVGDSDSGSAPSAGASPTDSAAAAASSDPLDSVSGEVAAQIKLHAKSKSYADFLDAVMGLPGVAESTTLMTAISDEGYYNNLKGA